MKFEKVLKMLREEKWVRRKEWDSSAFITSSPIEILFYSNITGFVEYTLSARDLFSEGWEEYKGKELFRHSYKNGRHYDRELTEEQIKEIEEETKELERWASRGGLAGEDKDE